MTYNTNLTPGNIKLGVNIGGQVGTLKSVFTKGTPFGQERLGTLPNIGYQAVNTHTYTVPSGTSAIMLLRINWTTDTVLRENIGVNLYIYNLPWSGTYVIYDSQSHQLSITNVALSGTTLTITSKVTKGDGMGSPYLKFIAFH